MLTSANRDRRRPYALYAAALATVILIAGLFAGWQIGKQSSPEAGAKLERVEARREAAEAAARTLVGELGRLCANFDFFFKHDMANGAFRPVRCSRSGRDETVLFAYGFDTRRHNRLG